MTEIPNRKVECRSCGWQGREDDLNWEQEPYCAFCPKCDSPDISFEDVKPVAG